MPELDWCIQIVMFAGVCARAVLLALRLRRSKDGQEASVNQGAQRPVGARATIATAIVDGRGEISLGDTVWPATGADLPAGKHVKVIPPMARS